MMLFTPRNSVVRPTDSISLKQKLDISHLEIKIQEAKEKIIYLDKSMSEKTEKIQQIEINPDYLRLKVMFNDLKAAEAESKKDLKAAETELKNEEEKFKIASERLNSNLELKDIISGVSGVVSMALYLSSNATKLAGLLGIVGVVSFAWSYCDKRQFKKSIEDNITKLNIEIQIIKKTIDENREKYRLAEETYDKIKNFNNFEKDKETAQTELGKNNQDKTILKENIRQWDNFLKPLKKDHERNKKRVTPQRFVAITETVIAPRLG